MSGLDPAQLLFPQGNMLYRGSPVTIFGVYREGGSHTVNIAGLRNGEPASLTKTFNLASSPTASSMIPQIWARQMIRKLRIEEGNSTVNKNRIIEISKQYQVLSDYTAFLAIRPVQTTAAEDSKGGYVTAVTEKKAGNITDAVSVKLLQNRLTIEVGEDDYLTGIVFYDLKGRSVLAVSFQYRRFKRFVWDGVGADGRAVSSGRYLVIIHTSRGIISRSVCWK